MKVAVTEKSPAVTKRYYERSEAAGRINQDWDVSRYWKWCAKIPRRE